MVKVALSHDARSFKFASARLKNSSELVLENLSCYNTNTWMLKYISKTLKDDELFYRRALACSSPFAFRFASQRLRASKRFAMFAMTCGAAGLHCTRVLKACSDDLRDDLTVAMVA